MGFGPVGTIRKQVMRQMKAKKKAENNIFNASLPNIKIPKSYSIKVPKSKIKFWYWEVRVMYDKKDMDDFFEFLGFQEALKNSQGDKSKDTLDDIFNTENDDTDEKNNKF